MNTLSQSQGAPGAPFFLLGLIKPRQNSRSDEQITQEYLQKAIKKDIFTQNISTFTLLTQFICLGYPQYGKS